MDCLARRYGIHTPLVYVLCDEATVSAKASDPLQVYSYFGSSGSLHEELIARLTHIGSIYKSDNTSVIMKIKKASRGTSMESAVKAFSRCKDGRGVFLAFVANHASNTKYRAIQKKRMNLL